MQIQYRIFRLIITFPLRQNKFLRMLAVPHYYKLKYFNQTRLHNATTRIQSVFEPITNFCNNLQKRLPFLHKLFIGDMSKIIDKEAYLIIDLHEGYEYNIRYPKSMGSSVIPNKSKVANDTAHKMVQSVNGMITDKNKVGMKLKVTRAITINENEVK